MADRYNHPDGLKAQDISLRGNRLEAARKGRMGHEASRLAEKDEEDRDKAGMVRKRTKKLEKAAGSMGRKPQAAVSGYMKKKKDVYAELDKAFE